MRTTQRWFQFQVSTWLILVAILCWAMAQRPYVVTEMRPTRPLFAGGKFGGGRRPAGGMLTQTKEVRFPNPKLSYPAIALLAFLALGLERREAVDNGANESMQKRRLPWRLSTVLLLLLVVALSAALYRAQTENARLKRQIRQSEEAERRRPEKLEKARVSPPLMWLLF